MNDFFYFAEPVIKNPILLLESRLWQVVRKILQRENAVHGKKYEQKLWNKFNACADKLFIEKNKKIEEEKLKLKNLNEELLKGDIDINNVIKELPTFELTKRSEEYKTISKSIRKISRKDAYNFF